MIVLTDWLQNPNTHDENAGTMLGLPVGYRHVACDATSSRAALRTLTPLCLLAHTEKHRLQPSPPMW
jgi:hypothetical protein